jgi:glycosyltransferase 2 family protein
VLFDRVLGLIGLIWLAAIFGIVFLSVVGFQQMDRVIYIVYGTIGLFAGTVIAWIILGFIPANQSGRLIERAAQIPKVGHTLAELLRAGVMYRARGKSVCLALFLAVIGHVAFVSTFYLSSLTLQPADEIPSLGTHFLIVPVGMTIQAGMPTPGGVGGAELAYDWLYELALRWSGPKGVMACILQRCVGWALSLLGYLIYLRMKPAAPTAPTNEQPDHAAPTTCDAVSG